MAENQDDILLEVTNSDYKYGFESHFDTEEAPIGLDESTIRFISDKKNEPEWLFEWRMAAFRHWQTLTEPQWANLTYTPADYQALKYYSAPKPKKTINSLDEFSTSTKLNKTVNSVSTVHPSKSEMETL